MTNTTINPYIRKLSFIPYYETTKGVWGCSEIVARSFCDVIKKEQDHAMVDRTIRLLHGASGYVVSRTRYNPKTGTTSRGVTIELFQVVYQNAPAHHYTIMINKALEARCFRWNETDDQAFPINFDQLPPVIQAKYRTLIHFCTSLIPATAMPDPSVCSLEAVNQNNQRWLAGDYEQGIAQAPIPTSWVLTEDYTYRNI